MTLRVQKRSENSTGVIHGSLFHLFQIRCKDGFVCKRERERERERVCVCGGGAKIGAGDAII